MTAHNADEILLKMAALLQESGVLEKKASGDAELNAIAGSLMTIADHLDAAGAEVAASRLDVALEKMARAGCRPALSESGIESLAADDMRKAASNVLIGIADRLDALGSDVALDVDRALTALAGHCMCPCRQCASAMGMKGHCGNPDSKCHAKDEE